MELLLVVLLTAVLTRGLARGFDVAPVELDAVPVSLREAAQVLGSAGYGPPTAALTKQIAHVFLTDPTGRFDLDLPGFATRPAAKVRATATSRYADGVLKTTSTPGIGHPNRAVTQAVRPAANTDEVANRHRELLDALSALRLDPLPLDPALARTRSTEALELDAAEVLRSSFFHLAAGIVRRSLRKRGFRAPLHDGDVASIAKRLGRAG